MSLQDAVIERISQGPFSHSLESYIEAIKRILWLKDKVNINSPSVYLSTLFMKGETECPVESDPQRQGKEQEDTVTEASRDPYWCTFSRCGSYTCVL